MTENLESIILENLRHIRGRVDRIAEDVGDLKLRQFSFETGLVRVKHEVAFGDETDARQQLSLDRLSDRIERIERRLDLINS
jgi:uncharacterized protein (UPF0335 family)